MFFLQEKNPENILVGGYSPNIFPFFSFEGFPKVDFDQWFRQNWLNYPDYFYKADKTRLLWLNLFSNSNTFSFDIANGKSCFIVLNI